MTKEETKTLEALLQQETELVKEEEEKGVMDQGEEKGDKKESGATAEKLPRSIEEAMIRLKAAIASTAFIKNAHNGHKNYNYADINSVLNVLNPILSRLQMNIIQNVTTPSHADTPATLLEPNKQLTFMQCETTFYALLEDGTVGSLSFKSYSEAVSLKKNVEQDQGSAQTYLKRYHLLGLLGLPFEEDNDAEQMTSNQQSNRMTLQQMRNLKSAITEASTRTHRAIVDIESEIAKRASVGSLKQMAPQNVQAAINFINAMK